MALTRETHLVCPDPFRPVLTRSSPFVITPWSRTGPATVPKNNREWWESKLQANVECDRDTDRRLAEAGWLVIRVWEHEAPTEAADRIERAVRARRPG
jgi:hypothetical protein